MHGGEHVGMSQEWTDWRWQQRNGVHSVDRLIEVFPGLPDETVAHMRKHAETRKIGITPYFLALIERDRAGTAPLPGDPLWRQVAPVWDAEGEGAFGYDSSSENWELDHEMVTPIAQHKYDNRIIVRYANVCHAYCQFCYEALRTLERRSEKPAFNARHWSETLAYLDDHPEIDEVILSGGEPLMHSDEQLAGVLGDLDAGKRRRTLRIHTRALTFNPFRVTDGLVEVLRAVRVNALGLHVSHPRELTEDFWAAARRMQSAVPILFANIPLLRGVNDDDATLRELCLRLYAGGVSAGYLYHFMPLSPGGREFATSVWRGVELVRGLRRRISNLAVPEYVLPHSTGKFTMPMHGPGTPDPQIITDEQGNRNLRFMNWLGNWVTYPDGRAYG